MAVLLREDGRAEGVFPAGTAFTLTELQELVGGYIDILTIGDDQFLVVDDEGLLKEKPINLMATQLRGQPIVGSAVLLSKGELE